MLVHLLQLSIGVSVMCKPKTATILLPVCQSTEFVMFRPWRMQPPAAREHVPNVSPVHGIYLYATEFTTGRIYWNSQCPHARNAPPTATSGQRQTVNWLTNSTIFFSKKNFWIFQRIVCQFKLHCYERFFELLCTEF